MRNQFRKRFVFLTVLWGFLLILSGMDTSFAVTDAVSNDTIETYKQWPMAVWYGLSVVLALIGYVKAKSKN